MIKNLVIVESPAKAKTIEKFLGKDFVVKSSIGHIRDLVKKGLGVDTTKNYQPTYEVSEDKKEVVKELKKLAKEADTVWLATDEDREGEAISWHLAETLGLDVKKTKRVVYHEITKEAIQSAIDNPRFIDINLVDAQQARRVLDRLVGFELSPVLWKKVKPSLSAGRVQSVTVRLIVEREREIKAFKTETYFKVIAHFDLKGKGILKAELPARLDSEKEATEFLKECAASAFKIASLETKPAKRSPAPPFITSTLQQEASRKLGYSVAQTMGIAQRLYEEGLISYMRTDSVNLSETAIESAKKEITKSYGKEYLEIRRYKTKSKGAQEAHEAIRPTSFDKQEIEGEARLHAHRHLARAVLAQRRRCAFGQHEGLSARRGGLESLHRQAPGERPWRHDAHALLWSRPGGLEVSWQRQKDRPASRPLGTGQVGKIDFRNRHDHPLPPRSRSEISWSRHLSRLLEIHRSADRRRNHFLQVRGYRSARLEA